MASAKKRQEERTDVVDWTDVHSDEQLTPHDDDEDDDDVDDDVIYDDDVSMPTRDADSMYDVIDRAPPPPPNRRTSGQMLRNHVTDVYGPMALVQ